MIETTNLTFQIGRHSLLQEITFGVNPGEMVAVVGPNGAGKSTLLRLIAGELSPTRGEITLMSKPLSQWSRQAYARRRAVLPQHVHLAFGFSVFEVVLMGRTPHNNGRETRHDWEIASQALEKVGLGHLAGRSYPTLSGGEQQRVQMARVLAQIWERPAYGDRYLLLDEPTNSLDLTYQHSILQLARQFADEGTAVLAILHDLNLAAQYADRVFMLKNGRMQCIGAPMEVITADRVRQVFGLPVEVMPHPRQAFPLILPVVQ